MNVLYISHLSNRVASGLNWSVPASVDAQSKIDNVLWVDLNDAFLPHWGNVKAYHNIKEYGNLKLENLPAPFSHPDVVVFEGFYEPKECFFAKVLRKKHIPYIIVPRCSLTHQALNNHSKLKKKIAHFFLFDSFAHHAAAIQYLTPKEYEDSSDKWNSNHLIIPNGFTLPDKCKGNFTVGGLKAIFIGRLDMYQKGLDILLEVIFKCKRKLLEANFSLVLYGPEMHDYHKIAQYIHTNDLDAIVSLGGEIFGEKKEQAILEADVMVMASRFEGLPMALLESMAYGLPCLVSEGTNMAEEVAKAGAGWCCDSSLESLEKALMKMIDERVSLKQKGEHAALLAKQYDWNVIAQNFHNQLAALL